VLWRFSFWGFSMSVVQQHISAITDTKTSLHTQLRELERLRDQVRQAEVLAKVAAAASLIHPASTSACPSASPCDPT
jgi:hypothetical protein